MLDFGCCIYRRRESVAGVGFFLFTLLCFLLLATLLFISLVTYVYSGDQIDRVQV
jgi:hypothetical protein